jgi:hypothetical protein
MKKNAKKIRPGRCQYCGCTENRACEDPLTGTCYWLDSRQTICSACGLPEKVHLMLLRDILAMVSRKVTLGALSAWTIHERAQALRWARAVHLKAGDHKYVRVPPIPGHVARLKEIQG